MGRTPIGGALRTPLPLSVEFRQALLYLRRSEDGLTYVARFIYYPPSFGERDSISNSSIPFVSMVSTKSSYFEFETMLSIISKPETRKAPITQSL
ncbi:hypothetical protein F2Q70_00023868 [Brassica cretica]|uniref:Uncharacterized protein n=1 Tax=Brassica cretica TaxID=69181 RepID=A0A8S9GPM4_BRACR|nr:hypothetical protein F2Q70_00023868 [Brassica cretica]